MDIGKTADRQEKKCDSQDIDHLDQPELHRIGGEFETDGGEGYPDC